MTDDVLSRNDIQTRDPAPMASRMDGSNMCMWKASVSSLSCFCGCAAGYPPGVGDDEHEMTADGEETATKVASQGPEAAYSHADLIDGILAGYRDALGIPQVIKEVIGLAGTKEEASGARPDFTGKYILSKVEGDPEKGLQNTGVGLMKRKAASAAGFGVNNVNVEVKQDGDEIKISSSTPMGSSTVSFRVGGGKQKNKASDGGEFVLDPVWEGDKLKAHMQRDKYETRLTRFMRGNDMIIESVTNGTHPNNMVREIYTRKP